MNRKQNRKSITALLLSLFLLLFQTNEVFAVVGTVSENETAGDEAAATVSDNQSSGRKETEAKSEENLEAVLERDSEKEKETMEDTVSGQLLPEIQAGAAAGPANPIHHCSEQDDSADYTDFDCIYFGSYPQREVTDKAVIAAIDKAAAISEVKGEAGLDVWVDGIKYRRISREDINNQRHFDDVPNGGYRYFRWERIKWKVLKNDGKTLFLLADKAIDCQSGKEDENSASRSFYIKSWLNNGFYDTAFNSREQDAIEMKTLVTEGEKTTNTYIYLLSQEEAENEEYGFCSKSYGTMSRRVQASDYANARGTGRSSSAKYKYNCEWRLRNYSSYTYTYGVSISGSITNIKEDYNGYGICPALNIELSASGWSMTDDGTSGSGGEEGKASNGQDKVKVMKLTLTGPSGKLAAGKTIPLSLQVFPENAANKAVSFQSSNPKYATVDKTGKVSIKKAGAGKTVTITAAALDGSQVKVSCKFKIMKHAVKKITLKAPDKILKAGKSMTVKANVKTTGKSVNKSLKWTSSNKKYATVNSKGRVTAKKAGKGKTVTITAAATDGSNKKAKVKIKIK